jgi:ketosteroid isomerase-like protein
MTQMKAGTRTTEEIEAAVKTLTVAYKTRNLKDLMACFAPDPDVVLYGTGADEKRMGSEQIRFQVERDWSQTESIEMSFTSSSISAAGNVSWAAMDGAFNIRAGGQTVTIPARISFVFEKRDDKWLIVHSHFSTPTAGQDEGSSI